MRNKKLIFAVVGVIAAALMAVGLILGRTVLPTANHAVKIAEVLKPMLSAENRSMQIDTKAVIEGESITLGCKVYQVQDDGVPYLVIEQNGHSVYVTDNILLLENGKAFKIADEMHSQLTGYSNLLPLISTLYEFVEITAAESDAETTYHIRVSADQAQQLLTGIFPAEKLMPDRVEDLLVSLITKGDTLDQIQLRADANGVQIHVKISDFHVLPDGEFSVPEVISETVAAVDPDELFSLTEDLYRLVLALEPFSNMDAINGKLKLTVDCALIQLDTTIALADLKNASGTRFNPKDLRALPEILGWLCLEGDICCTDSGGSYFYSLVLDQNSMKELSQMILPELASYAGDLTEGSVSVILEGDRIASMKVSIKGRINVLITKVPIAVGADFTFEY